MFRKTKKWLSNYMIVLQSINIHSKNMNININKNFKELNEKIELLSYATHTPIPVVNREDFKSTGVSEVKFSIVTAAYNAEKYLDEYFASFIKQRYAENLQIIIVDDGSIDGTNEKIQQWISKDILNIVLITQKNSGQSVARNKGLKVVDNKWVTFIDSDDYVSDDYFEKLAGVICNSSSNVFVTPWWMLWEKNNTLVNSHPLNFRFRHNGARTVNIEKSPQYINLSVSSCIFNMNFIKAFDMKFREEIKPNFEDAYFYNEYIYKAKIIEVDFVSDVKYIYRKRADESSTIDNSKNDPIRFTSLLEKAYLNGLENICTPTFKMCVLYDLRWNCEWYATGSVNIGKYDRRKIITKIMENFDINEVNYAHDKHIIHRDFKNSLTNIFYNTGFIYYEKFYETIESNILRIVTFENQFTDLKIIIDNEVFDATNFVNRSIIKYASELSPLRDYHIYLPKSANLVTVNDSKKIITYTKNNFKFDTQSKLLFMDRQDKADDNAEELYSYFKKYHTEFNNCYFALSKSSIDWKRLSEAGFNLIEYGSKEFDDTYLKSDFIFSSAGDSKTIENYKNLRTNQRFIFLQHGVTKDDLSNWLFPKKFDIMITATPKEQKFISDRIFNEDISYLVGFPRFDAYKPSSMEKFVISFTWRQSLEDKPLNTILNSSYFINIIKVINFLEMKKIETTLLLHPNVAKMADHLPKDTKYVEIIEAQKVNYKELFSQTGLFVTDYSSLAFDFALSGSKVIYYQFDREEFFASHTYTSSDVIFSYEKDGLGPIFENQDDFENLITNPEKFNSEKYNLRLEKLFPNNTHMNSEKLFNLLSNKF